MAAGNSVALASMGFSVVGGLGIFLLGMKNMSEGLQAIAGDRLRKLIGAVTDNRVSACGVGTLVTCLVQSSSVTTVMVVGFISAGFMTLTQGMGVILGANIGTTITALLASIGRSTDARRAAYFHTIFNLLGVLWITALFPACLAAVTRIVGQDPGPMVVEAGAEAFPHIRSGIAVVHSGFNIVNTLLFLPFLPLLAKLVTRLVPDKTVPEGQPLTYLDARMIASPAIGLQESHNGLLRMGEKAQEMMGLLRETLASKEAEESTVQKIFRLERELDLIEKELTEFVSHILSNQLPTSLAVEARKQLRMANEFESVGDYVVKILKLHLRKQEKHIWFSYDGWDGVLGLHDRLAEFLAAVTTTLREGQTGMLPRLRTDGAAITHHMKQSRASHLERVGTEETSPLASLIFTDMLNAYRRVKDHGLNVAKILAAPR
jgi:phosphate:Na+ symporter